MEKASSLQLIDLCITQRCPRYCDWCAVMANPYSDNHMALKNIKKILFEIKAYGCEKIILTGGCSFQHPKILDILRLIKEIGLLIEKVEVCPETFYRSHELLNYIYKYEIRNVSFSAPSGIKGLFKKFTKTSDSFDATIWFSKKLKNEGINIEVTHVLTKDTVCFLRDVVNFSANILEADVFVPLILQLHGRAKAYMDLNYKEFHNVQKEVVNLYHQYYNQIKVVYNSLHFPFFIDRSLLSNCMIGKHLYVFIDGNLKLCPGFSSSPLSLGNLFEDSLERLLTHPLFNICTKIPHSLVNDICASCPFFLNPCKCGCIARSFNRTSDIEALSKIELVKKRLFIGDTYCPRIWESIHDQ